MKVPSIPTLLVNGEMVSNFSKKAELFNKFFASQCTPLSNISILAPVAIRTDKRLLSLKINEDDVLSIIKSLNSNKSRGWDKLSINMVKMCDKTLKFTFKTHFQSIDSRSCFSGLLEKS